MKKVSLLVFLSVLLISCGGKEVLSTSFSPVDYVNPLVGTQSKFTLSTGNTYPAVALPWGMNFWTPQTGENRNGFIYRYAEDIIRGFRQTHQCSPWANDYAAFSLMPVSGELKVTQHNRFRHFRHEDEIAQPHYYKVTLDNRITAEMSPTERGVFMRFTYPEGKDAYVVLDPNACRLRLGTP